MSCNPVINNLELGTPDPMGYYVLVFKKEVLSRLKEMNNVLIEEVGDIVFVRVKSRSLAKKLIRKYRGFLLNP